MKVVIPFSLGQQPFYSLKVVKNEHETIRNLVGTQFIEENHDWRKLLRRREYVYILIEENLTEKEETEKFIKHCQKENWNYIILYPNQQCTGMYWKDGEKVQITKVVCTGLQSAFFFQKTYEKYGKNNPYHRQMLCYGIKLQHIFQNLHVGIVGVGGIGSAVTEQLVRMGIQEITIVDDDIVEMSNISRVYGSSMEDVQQKRNKVEALKEYIEEIGLGTKIHTVQNKLFYEETVHYLKQCDFIFGCTDDRIGRVLLQHISDYYGIPFCIQGVQIQNTRHEWHEAYGRTTLFIPEIDCFWCLYDVQPNEVQKEIVQYVIANHHSFGGYYKEPLEIQPSVIPYTTFMSSISVQLFLQYVMNKKQAVYDCTVRFSTMKMNSIEKREKVCNCQKKQFIGDCTPTLNLIWPLQK